ncbi:MULTISPECIES: helix-turn-helix domain-containing protein [Marivita]|uniref:Helix-turn-helix domain-containing protein n=1 Tax=Marivita cryptomonadis TaxID=505252 RepID=A0A9Q2S422_9RHOB|nr:MULTISPECIES: helix-turn-helix domain-containing protein [Marivita]MCR9168580.1 helix-turn-helix domain-containing protein [Paracoccaceae bacterium]MBM2323905.1 helix-turn-helix domain-containing protein [Marivita cryptomonadis]MBM2333494.1 helix-turn-helix domain-containing protein [Marivita cryptomonadis]MBM2343072.1 helix-turn-helix domain-containing protein [Marivita cryptomonadis]MBM2347743.1 helix-turn-helix domain-containing protein [Marivita cryptomonadis]
MEIKTASQLSTLGHPQRLAIFRMLMRRMPDKVPAGEIADALDIKASTLSAYLSNLLDAGLLSQTRVGTSLRYSVNVTNVQGMLDFLLLDCCRGRPDMCSPLAAGFGQGMMDMSFKKFSVLFICTGNSARSIFAETILRDMAGDRFDVYSAGTKPYSELNPMAVDVLRQKGHDVSGLRAKNVQEFIAQDAPKFDFVFTVCDQAANEDCPAWSGQPISAHWGMVDPVKASGSDAERSLAFQVAYGALRNRIGVFTALPMNTLDRISLQKAVDDIGQMTEEDASA